MTAAFGQTTAVFGKLGNKSLEHPRDGGSEMGVHGGSTLRRWVRLIACAGFGTSIFSGRTPPESNTSFPSSPRPQTVGAAVGTRFPAGTRLQRIPRVFTCTSPTTP